MPRDRAGNSLNKAQSFKKTPGRNIAKDWIDQNDKVDFYTFSINKSSNVKLKLGKLQDNLDLELLDFHGKRVERSRRPNAKAEKIKESLDAGIYYVRVSRRQGQSSYKLKAIIRERPEQPSDPNLPPAISPTEAIAPTTGLTPPAGTEDPAVKAERVMLIEEVVALTNIERTNHGLTPLTLNPLLNNSAQSQSADLALNDFFAHTSPTGTTLANRLSDAGYRSYQTAGENIAAGQITPTQVVQEWMNSPGHRANILNPAFTEIGVGYYFLANDTGEVNYNRYWTQNFGRPMS